MPRSLEDLPTSLQTLRERQQFSIDEVNKQLIIGPGWVEAWESGRAEPTLGMLAALLRLYGTDLATFFSGLDLESSSFTADRHLAIDQSTNGVVLRFPMGNHKATVEFPNANVHQCQTVLEELRSHLAIGQKGDGIKNTFFAAVAEWPHLNPSDLWYFFLSHAYQDNYNHPASQAGRDWGQSWKRAGGWALERIVVVHYNPTLQTHGVRLEVPSLERKRQLFEPMRFDDQTAIEKSDVLAVGSPTNGKDRCFGVIHIKASLAERRTDDAPLSQKLIRYGFVSPLVTMDCKATPSPAPVNRGEFGPPRNGQRQVSQKRLDIEQEQVFDGVFSFNANTQPTPEGQAAAARIHVCNFNNQNDAFARHLINKWRRIQGFE